MISELNQRSREIFRQIVDAYVATGEPVGSRTVARRLGQTVSPATVRNVMAQLEGQGLLYAPHTSAGRIPTEAGLRLFVHGLLEIGALSEDERGTIESRCAASGRSLPEVLGEASRLLSGLSSCAGLVVAPKTDRPLRHIEFVNLGGEIRGADVHLRGDVFGHDVDDEFAGASNVARRIFGNKSGDGAVGYAHSDDGRVHAEIVVGAEGSGIQPAFFVHAGDQSNRAWGNKADQEVVRFVSGIFFHINDHR